METTHTHSRYYLLYLPLVLSMLLAGNPVTSYLAAWLGSFFIFYISFANKVKATSPEIPLAEKILKPLFLVQIIFAGYMSCTSVFYFLDQMGYEYLTRIPGKPVESANLPAVAACQRYYLLGHAAMAHGLLFFYKSDISSKYQANIANWPAFLIRVVLVCVPVGMLLSRISGLSVLGNSIEGLSLVAATIALALAIPLRQTALLLIAGGIYAATMMQALTSGFKEPVIVSVLMLGLFLFPFYKKTIALVFLPLLLFLFMVLPTYVNTFRSQQRNESSDAETAKAEALKRLQEDLNNDNLSETNWFFLTDRISEIGMFVKYREHMENGGQFYGGRIVGQSVAALIPRIFWPEKPITEDVAMARAIESGIVSDESHVSAKPQYIVDGFLSWGWPGIWIALFFYGAVAQLASNKAEELFGGYFFGTAFVFTGMFRSLWRGNCFEFIFNNIFYSFAGLFALFFLLRQLGIIVFKQEEKVLAEPEREEAIIPAVQ